MKFSFGYWILTKRTDDNTPTKNHFFLNIVEIPVNINIEQRLRVGWPEDRGSGNRENSVFFTTSIPALGPTQPPIQWVSGHFPRGGGREADHWPPSSAEIKKAWSHTYTPPTYLWRVIQFEHRNTFFFIFYTPTHNHIIIKVYLVNFYWIYS
jgi:hypothetical protein